MSSPGNRRAMMTRGPGFKLQCTVLSRCISVRPPRSSPDGHGWRGYFSPHRSSRCTNDPCADRCERVTNLSHETPKRRALVLLNPNARHGQGRARYAAVQADIDEVFDTQVVETEPTGNDSAIRAALDDGIRTFI